VRYGIFDIQRQIRIIIIIIIIIIIVLINEHDDDDDETELFRNIKMSSYPFAGI